MTPASDSGIRTLIVDDDPAVLRLHATYLSGIPGFTLVGTVRTGEAAARFAADQRVDLILLDMNLPDFSGVEVLRRLRLVREWDVDVVVISSSRDTFTVRQALAAHVVGYLVKPFTKEAFVERLVDYRDGRPERRAESAVTLGQGEIDGLLGARTAPVPTRTDAAASLPKGLSESTMRLVLDSLSATTPVSVRDIADRSGASRATVRRYLDHLVRTGAVDMSHRFGARGRPEVLYRRAL